MKWLPVAGLFLNLVVAKNEASVPETVELSSSLRGNYQERTLESYNTTHHTRKGRVVFYVMGDAPYNDRDKLRFPLQIQALESRADFVVHVGDMKIRNPSMCHGENYKEVSDMLQRCLAPVFIVPGDNDWYECHNKTHGYQQWGKHFHHFEQKWSPSFHVRHQETRPENFAFVYKGVHFIGLHVLFASFREGPSLYQILNDDVEFFRNEMAIMHDSRVEAIVLFGHAFPHHNQYLPLYTLLKEAVELIDKPFIYIQGDLHEFTVSNPFPALENFMLVSVDMGRVADPLLVTVDANSALPFQLKRRPKSIIPS